MAFQRRRHHPSTNLRCLIQVLSTISVVVLLLLGVLSFLAPPLDNGDRHLRHRTSLNNGVEAREDRTVFHVPIGGATSDHGLWRSKLSKYYYGCSNSSNKFIKAEKNTQPNRYLMIATSGGLNQQRTG